MELSDEEKEIYRKFNDNLILCERFQDLKGFRISFQEALLLRKIIEKLQKENEELKEKNNKYENAEIFSLKQVDIIKEGVRQGTNEFVNENFIPKNKIRERLKEIDKALDTHQLNLLIALKIEKKVLKELLEEE